MSIQEKLKRLTEFSNRAAIYRAAGVDTNALWRYIELAKTPSIAVTERLARVLGIEHGWLVDSAQNWPPIGIEQPKESSALLDAA